MLCEYLYIRISLLLATTKILSLKTYSWLTDTTWCDVQNIPRRALAHLFQMKRLIYEVSCNSGAFLFFRMRYFVLIAVFDQACNVWHCYCWITMFEYKKALAFCKCFLVVCFILACSRIIPFSIARDFCCYQKQQGMKFPNRIQGNQYEYQTYK